MNNPPSVSSVALCASTQSILLTQCVVRNPLDSVFHSGLTEVEQQPHGQTGQPKIGQQLLGMNRMHHFRRFQLNDDTLINQQINAKFLGQSLPIPANRKRLLPFYAQSSVGQFSGKNRFISTFQKPWTYRAVHLASSINDNGCNFVQWNFGIHRPLLKPTATTQTRLPTRSLKGHGGKSMKNPPSVSSVALCA